MKFYLNIVFLILVSISSLSFARSQEKSSKLVTESASEQKAASEINLNGSSVESTNLKNKMSSFSSKAHKFSISYPQDWSPTEAKEPVVFSVLQEQKQASLIVMATTEVKMSCVDFLNGMDQSRGIVNIIPEKKRMISQTDLKTFKATEGVSGEYEVQGKGPGFPIIQKSRCFKSKDQIRVITVVYQKKLSTTYQKVADQILASFQFQI